MSFDIDWQAFAQKLMPIWWRKARFVAWFRGILSGMVRLYGIFMDYRIAVIYAMTHTGQTMSLEHILNDRFDPNDRGIYIQNLSDLSQRYIYRKVEGNPAPVLYRKWRIGEAYATDTRVAHGGVVWNATEPLTGVVPGGAVPGWAYVEQVYRLIRKNEALQPTDFIVWVPVLLVFDQSEMRGVIDTYRMASKRYLIQTY